MTLLKKFIVLLIILLLTIGVLLTSKPIRKKLLNLPPFTLIIDLYNQSRPMLHFSNNQECLKSLQVTNIDFKSVANQSSDIGCTIDNGVKVGKIDHLTLNNSLIVTCSMALALQKFESELLQVLAMGYFNQKVIGLNHMGSYNCRPMRGYKNLLSEHAFANAVDIASFKLSSGEVISVKKHWRDAGVKSKFLRDLAKRSCRLFTAVLTPDFDRKHADHFHFDQGLISHCH